MKENVNFADIVKVLIGNEKYMKLLMQVVKDNYNQNISLDSFLEDIFNKYCFIILIIGVSKKIEIEKYKIKAVRYTKEIVTRKFVKEYEEYIKIIEDEKFKMLQSIV